MKAITVQPDLFGEFDAAENERADVRRRRNEDRARYERREFIAAYDAQGGTAKGERVLGWVCPGCGGIAWSEFTLSLNHGYQPGVFERYPCEWTGDPWGTWCNRMIHRAHRAGADLPDVHGDSYDDVGVVRIEVTA